VRSLVVDMVGMVGVWVWGGVCLVGVVGLEGVEKNSSRARLHVAGLPNCPLFFYRALSPFPLVRVSQAARAEMCLAPPGLVSCG
jgi:hypothetical protein